MMEDKHLLWGVGQNLSLKSLAWYGVFGWVDGVHQNARLDYGTSNSECRH